ncbi:MAG: acetyltransferase [Anaerolineales bacterium]|nr:acetyltransferase [Anaerolineales bacterium]
MKSKVIGIGAGGHAGVIIDILQLQDQYEIVGLLERAASLKEQTRLGIPVIGDDTLLPELLAQGITLAFLGVGGSSDNRPRQQIYTRVKQSGFTFVPAIHPSAVVARSAALAEGIVVGPQAVVAAEAQLGENVIVNSGAIVEHECCIADHAHVATGAHLAGNVHVATGVHIGIGAVVRQGITIGAYAIVGAGAVVVKDVPPETVMVGVPAKKYQPLLERDRKKS